jgi:ubiquinone/menaquinone biosynthesis C-methylase UbiE
MFSDPQHNIEQFMLGEGAKVADFGAGSGHYTLWASQAVGDDGKVYAIEIQKDVLSRLSSLTKERGAVNVEVVLADLEANRGSMLKDASVDAGIVANILFQIEDKESFAKEVSRVIRPGGKILVVDWADSFGHLGPHPEHVVSQSEAKSLFEKQGFSVEKAIYAGEHHFGIIMRKGNK